MPSTDNRDPSDIALEKFRQRVEADNSLPQAAREAMVVDLGGAAPSELTSLLAALSRMEHADEPPRSPDRQ
jgi:hypothetical protein